MLPLDKFIDYVEDYPKLIVGSLLALILIAGVSGGLWINMLKDTIEQRKELCDAQKNVIIERHNNVKTQVQLKISKLKEEIDLLNYTIENELGILKNNKIGSNLDENLSKEASAIYNEINSNKERLSLKFNNINNDISMLYTNISSEVENDISGLLSSWDSEYNLNRRRYNEIVAWYILLIGVLFYLGYRFIYKKKVENPLSRQDGRRKERETNS